MSVLPSGLLSLSSSWLTDSSTVAPSSDWEALKVGRGGIYLYGIGITIIILIINGVETIPFIVVVSREGLAVFILASRRGCKISQRIVAGGWVCGTTPYFPKS